MKSCLMIEMNLVGQYLPVNPAQTVSPEVTIKIEHDEIDLELESLTMRTQENHNELRQMESNQESLAITYHNCTKINFEIQASQVPGAVTTHLDVLQSKQKVLQQEISVKIPSLLQQRLNLVDKLKDTVNRLAKLQQNILNDKLVK